MTITSTMPNIKAEYTQKEVKTNFTQKISKEEVSEIKEQIAENSKLMMFNETSVQVGLTSSQDAFQKNYDGFQSFLSEVGYSGKPIAELSQSEATALVSDDGIFGITQTSERIANFVINGSGGDEEKMRAGRAGMIQGFKDAEKMWGGELPEISQKSMQAAVEMVDKAMNSLGYSIINEEA
ncbi:hypothetical protein JHD48_01845 [Sulfurimonas sp. SAG-AH-194-I05]|nr:hypothetical protein [Sulfurimonas sp. SAG-AH-194-I05]MDF1874471.1 hypothetical protein [Sulfurimonas sp. SAG-AH-194-I05]